MGQRRSVRPCKQSPLIVQSYTVFTSKNLRLLWILRSRIVLRADKEKYMQHSDLVGLQLQLCIDMLNQKGGKNGKNGKNG